MSDEHLSPAETAKRLGVSAKALRLYERHGLVTPVRTQTGWRTYGPRELARLYQVLALKRLGLPLARIAQLLAGRTDSLDRLLALQETTLREERIRVGRALELVRAARAKLTSGGELSVEDLVTLTTETTMSKPTDDEMKAIFDPLIATHFTPEDRAELAKTPYDQAAVTAIWDGLIAEAKALMAKDDVTSPAAQDVARRWKAQVAAFSGGNPDMARKAAAVWKDAMADPSSAPRLPMTPDLMAFMSRAIANLKAE